MFSEKRLKVEIDFLNKGFVSEKTIVFENLPIQIKATLVGLPSGSKSVVKIYGVSKEHAAMITLLKINYAIIPKRKIRLFADNGNGYQLLYEGYIISAVPVYDDAPNVYVQIESSVGAFPNAETISSNSFDPNTPASQIFKKICSDFGYNCEEYTFGTINGTKNKTMVYDQIGLFPRLHQAEIDFNCQCVYKQNKFYIYPNDVNLIKRREHKLTPAKYSGYPTFIDTGIVLRLDNVEDIGLKDFITISGSEIALANSTWNVYKIDYDLQTFRPNGNWYMVLYGTIDLASK